MEIKLGAPQQCPACGHSNPSGLPLPARCMWCGPTGEQGRIKEMFEKAKEEQPMKPPIFKEEFGPIMGGLITDPIPGWVRKLEKRMSKLEKLAYTNPSGCCCKFDKDDNIIELCKAHADYFKKMR